MLSTQEWFMSFDSPHGDSDPISPDEASLRGQVIEDIGSCAGAASGARQLEAGDQLNMSLT